MHDDNNMGLLYSIYDLVFDPLPTSARFNNLTGQELGRLTVLGFKRMPNGKSGWYCSCSCGNLKLIDAYNLSKRITNSCGCLAIELNIKRCTTHGHCSRGVKSPEYRSYRHAKHRCNNPNNLAYDDYGGRGIKFLFDSFEQFLDELGVKPSPEYSIDRIDNDGNYERGNVRWATLDMQASNKRSNRNVEIDGKTQTISRWCDGDKNRKERAYARIDRLGWCDQCAVLNEEGDNCPHR
jgi:hypothetical protein